ncbi:MAG: radical SAM family heme chaperone HemW [Bacteroidales bacterium]|nr:radical SAM family heme chaperone HemW [Bacteroidales bacterium]
MAGLYLHIPWCKQACFYCDFHFRAALHDKDRMLKALSKELVMRSGEPAYLKADTLYFGGGTPSLLSLKELENLLEVIHCHYVLDPAAEITFEANPDDLTPSYLQGIRNLGINRLSIGIQSLDDRILKWMNRRHTAAEGLQSVQRAACAGFNNISVDLIYGIPGLSPEDWEKTLEKTLDLPVQHLSAYHLSIEEKTPFGVFRRRGQLTEAEESLSESHFQSLMQKTRGKGFQPYEISNFSLPGFQSRHNSAYWAQKPYLGAGPSAHSYDGLSRRWNIAHNQKYIECLEQDLLFYEEEILSPKDLYNEYLMTSLRTRKGADTNYIRNQFGEMRLQSLMTEIAPYLREGLVMEESHFLSISERGILLSDRIISDLFLTD